jgi:hypothetical protein
MANYRIYHLDGAGRILSGSDAQCTNDQEACAAAESGLKAREQAEVWVGTRCVGRVRGGPQSPRPKP